jgi:hypothetical protein
MAALDNAVIDPALRQSLVPLRALVKDELAVLEAVDGHGFRRARTG